jgi:hypothetical protein
MPSTATRLLASSFAAAFIAIRSFAADPSQVIELWPNGAPGEKGSLGEEKDTTKPTDQLIAGKPIIRLGYVTKPTISLYRPPASKNTGTAVVVSPWKAPKCASD